MPDAKELFEENRDKIERFVPYGVIVLFMVFMARVRLNSYDNLVSDGQVKLMANDPWYHKRVAHVLVENFPAVYPFDVYTYFPYGSTASSGFGGLYTQTIAAASMIIGLGSPSEFQVDLVTAYAPVAYGVAVVIPVYFIARKLTDKWIALFSVLSLALMKGQFLNRTTFGNSQHQAAEAFFMAVAVLGFLYTVEASYRYKPTLAHIQDRDWSGLRKPVLVSVLGGVGYICYVITWPAGVFLVAPLGVFIVLQSIREVYKNGTVEYLSFNTAIYFFTTAIMVFIYAGLLDGLTRLSGAAISLIQPLIIAGVAIGAVFLFFLQKYIRGNDYDKSYYPISIAVIGVFSLLILYITGYSKYALQLVKKIYGFGYLTSAGALTVAEISPANLSSVIVDFGGIFLFAVFGLVLLVYRVVMDDRPLELVTLLWSATTLSAYFTMIRFGYYASLGVAVLVSYSIYQSLILINLDTESISRFTDMKGYQIIIIALIVALFIPFNLVTVAGISPVWTIERGPSDSAWHDDALPWMANNTPDVDLDYNEVYDVPSDRDYDYPVDESPLRGVYGVMSWWDYGHWITNFERIPNANPFQEGNIQSSDFFTAQTEERSNLVVEALPSISQSREGEYHLISNEELRETIQNQNQQERYEDTRYVIIDDRMAAGKFGAIGTWTEFGGFIEAGSYTLPGQEQEIQLPVRGEKYYNTTLARLYYDDADDMNNYRLIHETETYALIGSRFNLRTGRPSSLNRLITRLPYDRTFITTGFEFNNQTQEIPLTLREVGFLGDNDIVDASGDGTRYFYDLEGAASVKTYERVEGAKITGTVDAEPGSVVTAEVTMNTTNTLRRFTYTQTGEVGSSGSFELTVPYSTDNSVDVDDGGTNSMVVADNNYTVTVKGEPRFRGSVEVPEMTVYMGDEVEVDMERVVENESSSEMDGIDLDEGDFDVSPAE